MYKFFKQAFLDTAAEKGFDTNEAEAFMKSAEEQYSHWEKIIDSNPVYKDPAIRKQAFVEGLESSLELHKGLGHKVALALPDPKSFLQQQGPSFTDRAKEFGGKAMGMLKERGGQAMDAAKAQGGKAMESARHHGGNAAQFLGSGTPGAVAAGTGIGAGGGLGLGLMIAKATGLPLPQAMALGALGGGGAGAGITGTQGGRELLQQLADSISRQGDQPRDGWWNNDGGGHPDDMSPIQYAPGDPGPPLPPRSGELGF